MTTTPTAAARVSGTIKALDWKANGLRHATALGFNTTYTIMLLPDGSGARWQSRYMGEWFDAADSEAAKAAAQADYEARILAAIQPDPEPVTTENYAGQVSSAGTVSVEAAARVLMADENALRTLVDFQLRHSATASDKARSMRHVQMKAALRALAGEGER